MGHATTVFHRLPHQMVLPTELARGPWGKDYAFGGAPSGLAVALIERELDQEIWMTSRVSLDFVRPFPLRRLSYALQERISSSVAHHWLTFSEATPRYCKPMSSACAENLLKLNPNRGL